MVIKAESHRIQIGSADWRHQGWNTDFYPEDLPADWRLAYYGNEFPVVLLPTSAWREAIEADLAEWSENSDAGFHFLFELPPEIVQSLLHSATAFTGFLNKLSVFQQRVGALVIPCQPEVCTEVLLNSRCDYPRVLDFGPDVIPSEQVRQQCHDAGVGVCSHDGKIAVNFISGLPILVRVASREYDLKALRKLLEEILRHSTTAQACYLIFEGEPPQIEIMQNARTLLELL